MTTSIYNLILGKLYCDHYGTMRIQGNREYSCKLKFKEQSIIDRNPHQVITIFASTLKFIFVSMSVLPFFLKCIPLMFVSRQYKYLISLHVRQVIRFSLWQDILLINFF